MVGVLEVLGGDVILVVGVMWYMCEWMCVCGIVVCVGVICVVWYWL